MTSSPYREEYLRLSANIQDLTATLNYQQQIQAHRTIPVSHQPRKLKTSDVTITKEFEKDYEYLFFNYLDKAITNNNIQLELRKAALAAITLHINTDQKNTEQKQRDHTTSYDNNSPNSTTSKQTQNSKKYKRGNRGQKRKGTTTLTLPQPKYPKPNHFLFQGHPTPQPPT